MVASRDEIESLFEWTSNQLFRSSFRGMESIPEHNVAFEHVPTDFALQRKDVLIVPVPQQAFLDSKNP